MSFRRLALTLSVALASALAFVSCSEQDWTGTDVDRLQLALSAGLNHVPNEVIIKFQAGASEQDKGNARAAANAAKSEDLRKDSTAGDTELATLPPGIAIADAVRDIQSHPAVAYAEPNWIYQHQATPNDPSFGQLWGLNNTGQTVNGKTGAVADVDVDAPEAWDLATGSELIYVGIIDEGIDFNHTDLAGSVINPAEDANGDGQITAADLNGLDDDGNGYVDDVRGWDFANGDNSIFDGRTVKDKLDAHGTHVAGTIGGIGNNGTGVSGVNWRVRFISGKFLGKRGGTTSNAVKAVDYFTNLKNNEGINLVATNNSWGGGGYSQSLYDAIQRANAAGILFIAAAGNGGSDGVGDNNDSTPSYPASYANANIISVASIERTDAKSSFSNFGATSVDVGAPGGLILSTTPFNGYSYYSGTSMATPHVTGLAALLKAYDGTLTADQIKDRILSSVVTTPALSGKCVSGGRINAYKALSGSTLDP